MGRPAVSESPNKSLISNKEILKTAAMKNALVLFLLSPFAINAQPLPDSTIKKIDEIFKNYNVNTPGCAVAVMRKGEVVFKKGYGMATLEFNVPITSSTIFHIASESKQYVAFCMLLLEQQGKLSLDDDIRKYLDFVPDFGKKITIKNLIYHTSGLRDQWQLLANAGWQLDDVITQDHVIKLVSKQKELNFPPGEEMLYCNTGYTLMAEIVKKTSGQSLRKFCDSAIFKPLGMNDTHFHDDYREIVKNRAYSYSPRGSGGYQNAVLSYSIVGATSLFTTVEDEMKWLHNYETGQVGGKALIEKMYQTGVLNDGKKLNYAFAISIDNYKGWKYIGHGGGDAGFRTYACRYPDLDLGIVVFSNAGNANPFGFCRQIADQFLTPKQLPETPKGNPIDTNFLKRLEGKYYSHRGLELNFDYDGGKLMSRPPGQTSGGNEWKLTQAGPNRYEAAGLFLIFDSMNGKDSIREFKVENFNGYQQFYRQPANPKKVDPTEYIGRYYSEETEAFYTIAQKDNNLILQHRKFSDVVLEYDAPDQFTNNHWWMNNIRFLRDNRGKVAGFEVNTGRIVHLRYDKVK
jgi:CubicO group peptidase (beta-lactamase class C family)